MKRIIIGTILTLLVVAGTSIGVVAAFPKSSGSGTNAIESTGDIGARWDLYAQDGMLTPATFRPTMSKDEAIAKAIGYLKSRDNWDAVALGLPVRTTVGLFSGQTEDGGPWVTNLKARVVVFDNIPIAPIRPPGYDAPYTGMVRFTMVLDDATGEFVYGTIIGGPKE